MVEETGSFVTWAVAALALVLVIPLLPPLAAGKDRADMPGDEARTGAIGKYAATNAAAVGESRQIVFVTNSQPSSPAAVISWAEKVSGEWRLKAGPLKANVGRNGFAAPGRKREGDGMTPSGLFRLGTAFGYGLHAETRMAYRQATEEDFWVDDSESPSYNRWVKGKPDAVSYEKMRRDDDQYRYGIVVEYNTDPVVKGLGSAIFIHLWKDEGEPTSGCVSISTEAMLRLLSWLDPACKPIIVMGTEADVFSSR